DLAERLGMQKEWDAATRDTLFSLVGDRDSWVRREALAALAKCSVDEDAARRIEPFLARKSSEMRQGVLRLLKKQKNPAALASVDRLLAGKKIDLRMGALELMSQLVSSRRLVTECRERARQYQAARPQRTELEDVHLADILNERRNVPTLEDGLGLF